MIKKEKKVWVIMHKVSKKTKTMTPLRFKNGIVFSSPFKDITKKIAEQYKSLKSNFYYRLEQMPEKNLVNYI